MFKHRMNLGYNILSIDQDRRILRSAQCSVKDCALFRDVDLLPLEHCVDSGTQSISFCNLQKKSESFIGYAVLGVVKKQASCVDRHSLSALRIGRKKLAQVQLRYFVVV